MINIFDSIFDSVFDSCQPGSDLCCRPVCLQHLASRSGFSNLSHMDMILCRAHHPHQT